MTIGCVTILYKVNLRQTSDFKGHSRSLIWVAPMRGLIGLQAFQNMTWLCISR